MRGKPLALSGCAPTPLASYLKALGVLRLISSPANHVSGAAADPHARGWWENERFHLRTTLDRDTLLHFFLHDYAPSPIIAPWNGGSGFYLKDNKEGFNPLASGQVAVRFASLAAAIRNSTRAVARLRLSERPEGANKAALVAALRGELLDTALPWLDAVLALSGGGLAYPELLGTGGNDGRLDFTNNYARRLVSRSRPAGLFDASSGQPTDGAPQLLANSLLGTPVLGLCPAAVGQFAPGAAGGPNATNGYTAEARVNPWDFVLMLEGATAFAGTATRRHQHASGGDTAGTTTRSGASFPFTVRCVGAGWGGVGAGDENDARAEFWAPIWTRPTRAVEIECLLGEGRAVLHERTARDGLDFARAAASLGVSRGFHEFERFGFLMRAGRTYLAAPIGRRSAAPSPAARLVADLDAGGWLDRVRRVGRGKDESGTARRTIKQLEDALFALSAATGGTREAQSALIALGHVLGWLAVSSSGRVATGRPPPVLSPAWIRSADDRSAEFRVAAALASLGLPRPVSSACQSEAQRDGASTDRGRHPADERDSPDAELQAGPPTRGDTNAHPPMAAHFAPVNEQKFFYRGQLSKRRAWTDTETPRTVVWGAGPLVPNLIAVLERRLVESSIRGLEDKPLSGGAAASLADVTALVSGDFNDERCAQLLAGLVWAQPTQLRRVSGSAETGFTPFAYAALKPVFAPDAALRATGALPSTARMPIPPELTARLRAAGSSRDGRATEDAVGLAFARARASGLPTPFAAGRAGARRSRGAGGRMGAGVPADRLAAALLIPIHDRTLTTLIRRAYPGAVPEGDNVTTEDTTNEA